jgi:hypothetical protein
MGAEHQFIQAIEIEERREARCSILGQLMRIAMAETLDTTEVTATTKCTASLSSPVDLMARLLSLEREDNSARCGQCGESLMCS